MRPYDITSIDLLKTMLAELSGDDLTKPWTNYPCVEWPRGRTPDGYPTLFHIGLKKKMYVTRLALTLGKGESVEGLYACHHCDNPPCIRPIHLFAGSGSDNTKDCVAKGRWNRPQGSQQHSAKLDEEKVRQIRALRESGLPTRSIADIYGVCIAVIYNINKGMAWKHVK